MSWRCKQLGHQGRWDVGLVETLSQVVQVSLWQPGSLIKGVVKIHHGAGAGLPKDGQLDEIDQIAGQRRVGLPELGDQGQVLVEQSQGQLQERQVGLTVDSDLKPKKKKCWKNSRLEVSNETNNDLYIHDTITCLILVQRLYDTWEFKVPDTLAGTNLSRRLYQDEMQERQRRRRRRRHWR